MTGRFRLFWIVAVVFLAGCRQAPERSFYYWKTTFTLSDIERKSLQNHRVSKLYLRFFDVDWDAARCQIVPLGRLYFRDTVPEGIQVVPTVYVVNKSLQKISDKDVPEMSKKILGLVNGIATTNRLTYREIQIDCDWTETTRKKYFMLLTQLRSELKKNHQTISATIRLHQVKYAGITGIPPVDRGMLMYYNMGKIEAGFSRNSVYNPEDAAKYIESLAGYKLPLDVAFPAFSWGIHVRNNKVIELLNNLGVEDFKNNDTFAPIDSVSFRVMYSMFYHGFYFKKDDIVKVEEISPALCKTAAKQISGKMAKKPAVVAIFHLDSTIISHYEKQDLEEVFTNFR